MPITDLDLKFIAATVIIGETPALNVGTGIATTELARGASDANVGNLALALEPLRYSDKRPEGAKGGRYADEVGEEAHLVHAHWVENVSSYG
ncbi:MAG: hypothetical protein R3C68_18190 [Myxococcota bacterium]